MTTTPATMNERDDRIKALLIEAHDALRGPDDELGTAGLAVVAALHLIGIRPEARPSACEPHGDVDPVGEILDDMERESARINERINRCIRRMRDRLDSIERDVEAGWHAEGAPSNDDLVAALQQRQDHAQAMTAVQWAYVRTLDAPDLIALAAKRFNALPEGMLNQPDDRLYNALPGYEKAIVDRIVKVLDDPETFTLWSVLSQVQDEAFMLREGVTVQ